MAVHRIGATRDSGACVDDGGNELRDDEDMLRPRRWPESRAWAPVREGAAMMNDEVMLLTVPEAARVLRISRNLAYELVARGEIPAIRLGRVIRVPRAALEEWVKCEAAPS